MDKIKKLDWDSDFFGFPIGKVELSEVDHFSIDKLKVEEPYKLIYIFTKRELNLPQSSAIRLVDKKVTLVHTVTPQEQIHPTLNLIREYDAKTDPYQELLDLAYLSGKYSRFKLDQGFGEERFRKMYKKWQDNSISKKIATATLVAIVGDKIAGFVTLSKEMDSAEAQIGLVAVSPKFQGKGIGKELMKAALKEACKQQAERLYVATQADNKPAVGLYLKEGFVVHDITYIYHFWM